MNYSACSELLFCKFRGSDTPEEQNVEVEAPVDFLTLSEAVP